jgi:hypothetical protein
LRANDAYIEETLYQLRRETCAVLAIVARGEPEIREFGLAHPRKYRLWPGVIAAVGSASLPT